MVSGNASSDDRDRERQWSPRPWAPPGAPDREPPEQEPGGGLAPGGGAHASDRPGPDTPEPDVSTPESPRVQDPDEDAPEVGASSTEPPAARTPGADTPPPEPSATQAPGADAVGSDLPGGGRDVTREADLAAAPHPGADADAGRVPPPPHMDPNQVAIDRAGLSAESADWLRQVAGQVDARLDRVSRDWRQQQGAEAARACVFGLLLAYLARTYPHVRGDLSRVAEAHPSYSTLGANNRLATLEQIVADLNRATAWIGPLIDVRDPERMRALLD